MHKSALVCESHPEIQHEYFLSVKVNIYFARLFHKMIMLQKIILIQCRKIEIGYFAAKFPFFLIFNPI